MCVLIRRYFMACFTAPLAEAVIVKAVEKHMEKKEASTNEPKKAISAATKVSWLSKMLFGGSALLAFEHVWHGEITPWFPFLTAMMSKEDMVSMLHEIATVGVGMALLITVVWVGMCKVADVVTAREVKMKEAVK